MQFKIRFLFRFVDFFTIFICTFAMNCDFSEDKSCLDVFDSSEASKNPKCFCTNLCPDTLPELKANCLSGQMLPDECGTCLVCAKTRGQECGGFKNRIGTCILGFKCLVRFNANDPQEEHQAVGTCVDEDSPLCPGPEVFNLDDGVNCRPGRLGIISEALYCPVINGQKNVAVVEESTTITSTTTPPLDFIQRPSTLIDLLLSHIPRPGILFK